MKYLTVLGLTLCCLVAAGCTDTSLSVQKSFAPTTRDTFSYLITPEVDVSAEALEIMKTRLQSQLADSLQSSPNQPAKKVEIVITNYHMRHGAARAIAGIMAGSDNILSQVTVRDAVTGAVLAEFVVESKNPSAWGTSRGLIEEHIDKIVSYLKSGRR